jgi:hypothetical protein
MVELMQIGRPSRVVRLRRDPDTGGKICRNCDNPVSEGERTKRGLCRTCRHLVSRKSNHSFLLLPLLLAETEKRIATRSNCEPSSPRESREREKPFGEFREILGVPQGFCYVCMARPRIDNGMGLCDTCTTSSKFQSHVE